MSMAEQTTTRLYSENIDDYVNNEDKVVGARPPARNRIADALASRSLTSG